MKKCQCIMRFSRMRYWSSKSISLRAFRVWNHFVWSTFFRFSQERCRLIRFFINHRVLPKKKKDYFLTTMTNISKIVVISFFPPSTFVKESRANCVARLKTSLRFAQNVSRYEFQMRLFLIAHTSIKHARKAREPTRRNTDDITRVF